MTIPKPNTQKIPRREYHLTCVPGRRRKRERERERMGLMVPVRILYQGTEIARLAECGVRQHLDNQVEVEVVEDENSFIVRLIIVFHSSGFLSTRYNYEWIPGPAVVVRRRFCRRSVVSRAPDTHTRARDCCCTASSTGRRMPQQTRKKRDNAAASKKAKQAATTPVPSRDSELPQAQDTISAPTQHEERKKSHLYLSLIVPIILLIATNSLVAFFYIRALDPLYGSVPINIYIDKVVWAATIIGAFGPVPPLWPSFAIFGGLVISIPTSSYWVALYTGRTENPAVGATATHLVVLFPILYFGVSLVKRITVRLHDSFPLFSTRSQYLGYIRVPFVR